MNRTTLFRHLGAAAGLLFFVWTLRGMDFGQTSAALQLIAPLLLLAFAPFGLSVLLDGWGMSRLLRLLGREVDPVALGGVRLSAEAIGVGLPAGPILAESVKPLLLRDRHGVSLPDGISGVAARKRLILISHGITLGIGALLGWSFLSERALGGFGGGALPWIILLVAVALSGGGLLGAMACRSEKLAARVATFAALLPLPPLHRWLHEKSAAFSQADESLAKLLAPKTRLQTMGIYVAMWLCEAVESWMLLHLLGFKLGFVEVLAIEVTVSAIRNLAFFVPAGLGFQEACYLTLLGSAGTLAASAPAFVIAKRLREICFMGVGVIALLADSRRSRGAAPAPLPEATPIPSQGHATAKPQRV